MKARDMQDCLLGHGIKPSVQRLAVMEYLKTHCTHPTADEIFSALSPKMPTLSRTTVYNTLRLLASRGAVLSLDIDGKNTRFDGDTRPHAHWLCRGCGAVRDLPLPVDSRSLTVRFEKGTVDEVQLYYKGYCENCRMQSEG